MRQAGKQAPNVRFGGGAHRPQREFMSNSECSRKLLSSFKLMSNSECSRKLLSSFKHGLTCSGFHFRITTAGM